MKRSLLLLGFPFALVVGAATAPIDANFPGGNIAVQREDGRRIFVAPDLRDTQPNQWWFYFNFRLKPSPENPREIVFTGKNPIGVRGPAMSSDRGETWRWLGANTVTTAKTDGQPSWSFEASVPEGSEEARFAYCPPYLENHLKSWIERHRDNAALRISELCQSRKGRSVELIRAGCLDSANSRGVVLLTSRHHCCEAMATYALEGILEAALAEDDLGKQWRDHWEIIAVPFMDKDGCEEGDQGKNRAPHDHNRDYNAKPIYPEVAALMKLGASLQDRVVASVDLHCPGIRGEWHDRAYLVGASDEGSWQKQKSFAQVWSRVQKGPVRFREQDCLAYGTSWNVDRNYTLGRSSSGWARDTFHGAKIATTIEIPYADALGVEVNAASARALGSDLARALAEFLSPRQ